MSARKPALVAGLQTALRDQKLHMLFQPKLSLSDGEVTRVEALVRWDDPEFGTVEPSLFVPLAEAHGLIDDLTLWGLRTIVRQWVEWSDKGVDTAIALNISALSLQNLDFPDLVERMCRALDMPTDRLVLELTEGATQPLIKLMDTLTRFRIKGIGLAIDDFGTGYSSLMQLRQLPFTEVKIDRAFVADAIDFERLPPDRQDDHRPRPRARPDCHGGGCRDGRSAASGARSRLRPGPGLSHRSPDASGGLPPVASKLRAPLAAAQRRRQPATEQCRSGRLERAANLSRN